MAAAALTRRAFLKTAPAAHLALAAAAAAPRDPLLDAIDAYREAADAYNDGDFDDDDLTPEEFALQPHVIALRTLKVWSAPALSAAGAFAALQLAYDDMSAGHSDEIALPMIGAAMAFLFPDDCR